MTMSDPVKTGLVASLARPGGNLTGLCVQSYELWPKQLQLARELIPALTKIAFLFDTNDEPDALSSSTEFGRLARDVGMTVVNLPVRSATDIPIAMRSIQNERPQAVVVWISPLLLQNRDSILRAIGHKVPIIGDGRGFAEAGALLTYAVDYPDLFRRSATYVDKILRGVNPGDLPIEQPTKFELIVNLQTAKALHTKIPESILVRADKIIR